MTPHPDDATFLDQQHWVSARCSMGSRQHNATVQLVVEVDHIEQGTLPGHPLYSCRSCLAYRLGLDRVWAEHYGDPAAHRPALRHPQHRAGAGA